MQVNYCVQCKKVPTGASNRLVHDSCGHEKCRVCLLEDEDNCTQCKSENTSKSSNGNGEQIKDVSNSTESESPNLLREPEALKSNHTAVIKINGNMTIEKSVSIEKFDINNTVKAANLIKVDNNKKNIITDANGINNTKDSFKIEKGTNKNVRINPDPILVAKEIKNINRGKIKKAIQKTQKLFETDRFNLPKNLYTNLKKTENEQQNNLDNEKKNMKKDKKRRNSIDMPEHIVVAQRPLSYHCTRCDKRFFTKGHVSYHRFCGEAVKPFKCEVCGKEFILRAQLEVHSYKHKEVKPHACQVCQKTFASRNSLRRHSELHSNVKSYICSQCGNAYRSKESLRIHAIIHRNERPYACKLCSAKFSNISNLNKHITTHSKEKTHMCDQCGKRFKRSWGLSVHRKTHLRIRPYQCNVCFKRFYNNKDLQRHTLIHTETKGYACSICKTNFCRKDNLYRHVKNTHPGKKAEAIESIVKPPVSKPKKKHVVDNPNAINVITASPAFTTKSKAEAVPPVKSDSRTGTVINGPIKLAFKTPAFKSSYNINRNFNYVPPIQVPAATYDMAESLDICQKILSPHTFAAPQSIAKKSEPISLKETFHNIMLPSKSAPTHYETSFQNRKHALIKNIKFKVPIQYTNSFQKEQENASSDSLLEADDSNNNTYAELQPVAMTSVIVNNSAQPSSMHWRRRTSQNLNLKN